MHAGKRQLQLAAVITVLVGLGFCACSGTVASRHDASTSGGAGGAGGVSGGGGTSKAASDGSRADAAVATGGTTSSGGGVGGNTLVDAPIGAGGIVQTGGQPGTGGRTGAGGSTTTSPIDGGKDSSDTKTGAGGSTGLDAAPLPRCGGEGGASCLNGEFCDMLDHCSSISDGSGHCVPAGPNVVCDTVYAPVCGCDGTTYDNDCRRGAAKVKKFSDGPCAAGRDASTDLDRNGGVTWQAAPLGAASGPGIVVIGRGWWAASTDSPWQFPGEIVYDGSPSGSLTYAQLEDLFVRFGAIDFSALPHAPSGTATCHASLMFAPCTSCARQTLTYSSAAQLAPEMEPVWAWFDQVLGSATVATNPRTYCSP